jgi:hypothetical protein
VRRIAQRAGELKHTTGGVTYSNTSYNANSGIANLYALSQGTSATTRLGDKIRLTKLQVRGRLYTNANEVKQTVRFIIAFMKSVEGTGIDSVAGREVVAELLESWTNVHSFYNIQRSKNFRVMYDEIFEMGGGTHPNRIPLNLCFKTNLLTRFSANGGDDNDFETWMPFVYCYTTEADGAPTDSVSLTLRTRARFYDQ